MTIRFLQSWNGYQPDQIVSGLTNEASLIAAGIAREDLDGDNDGGAGLAKWSQDASGNLSLIGPDGNIALPINRSSQAATMLVAVQNATVSASTATWLERFVLKAPFRRFRIHLYNMDTSAASGTYTILAAVSELLDRTTASRIWRPVVGGVEQTALRANKGSPGWAQVTWGGDTTKQVDIAPSSTLAAVATSDWIDMSSIDRTDGDGYVFLLRYQCDTGNRTIEGGISTATAPRLAWLDPAVTNRAWWFFRTSHSRNAGGGVADLTLDGTATDQNTVLAAAVEFDFDVQAYSVLAYGDSLCALETAGTNDVEWGNWVVRGCGYASSAGRVFLSTVLAKGGQTFTQYSATGLLGVATQAPGIVLHPVWSPNDGTPGATTMGLAMANLTTAINTAEAAGSRLVAWGPLPNNGYTETADGYRLALIERVKAIAATGRILYLDFEGALSDGATPARWVSGLNYDATHPSEAGVEVMGQVFRDFLRVLPAL